MTQAPPPTWPLTSAPPEGTPASVAAACRSVGHDLLASATVGRALPALAWWLDSDELLPEGFVVLGLATGADRLAGFGLDPDRPVAEVVAEVADRVQQHLTGYELLQWPPCADGRHVLQPIAARAAVWSCDGPPPQRVLIGEWSPPR